MKNYELNHGVLTPTLLPLFLRFSERFLACIVGLHGLGLDDHRGVATLHVLRFGGDGTREVATRQTQHTTNNYKKYFLHFRLMF